MTTRTFAVPDVTCGHCKASIEGELLKLDTVTTATVDVDAKLLTVEGTADVEAIELAVEAAGYEALPA